MKHTADQNPFTNSFPAIAELMAITGAQAEAISPDGELLAYLDTASGLPQIWLRPLAGGAPWRAVETPERVGKIAFSPVSRDLLFTMDRGGDERHQLWLLPDASGTPRPLTDDPTSVHAWGAWSPDGEMIAYTANMRDRAVMDVLVQDIASGTARTIVQWEGYCEVLGFSGDGAWLLVRDSRRATMDQDLWLVEIATGACRKLFAHEGRWHYASVKLRKAGGVFVLCDADGVWQALYASDKDMAELTPLAAHAGADIELFALSSDQTQLAYVVNDQGVSRLFVRPLEAESPVELDLPHQGIITSARFAPDGNSLLVSLEGPIDPPAIWRLSLPGGEGERLTRPFMAGVAREMLVAPEITTIAGHGGLPVPVFVYRPQTPPPQGGYPVLFMVHGGPESQWRAAFRADLHHYLGLGMMVIAPNVRGSTGYGRAFHEMDDKLKRFDAVDDLCALAEAVGAWEDVDADHIGVMGQSYGGFMVLSAMTRRPDLWRSGIDLYGISNFTTLMMTTGPWRRTLRAAEYGDPEEMGAFLSEISPIHAIGAIKVPLLLVHATEDPRVPLEQSEQVFSMLRGLGRPVEIIRVAGEGHGFARRENRVQVFSRIAAFLARTLVKDMRGSLEREDA